MFKLISVLMAALLWISPGLQAQTPGAYPHLVLTDGHGTSIPGPGGPFDNSGLFPAFSGLSFKAQVTYQSAGQPNSNVLWGLLVSVAKTPLPLNVTPPSLLTMPPFILMLPVPPNLSGGGFGEMPLYVPAGVYSAETYVQGMVYDVTSAPTMRLTNGLKVTVEVPQFSVNLVFTRSKPAGGDGQLKDVGVIDIDADTLNTLKPIGTKAPPEALPGPPPLADDYRFLAILPNAGDEPVNPLARPITRIQGSVAFDATTIPVKDTRYFPTTGRILIAFSAGDPAQNNLWKSKATTTLAPNAEVVSYNGTTPTSFLNCKRAQLGSRGSSVAGGFFHVNDEMVVGFFTMATTVDARLRTRVGLDADNRDTPHVVVPQFTFDAGGDLGTVTRDLDIYRYETLANKIQGFMVLDRITGLWRAIPGTAKNELEGRWDPMVAIAPDGRSMIAHLEIPGGLFGWDNNPDGIVAIRLDGLNWPASGSEAWMIPYQTDPDPVNSIVSDVRSRRVWMPAAAIIGANPDNYVAYVGLAHKWRLNPNSPGSGNLPDFGYEAEYVAEEVIVRDMIECPLTPPASTKSVPSMPRPYLTGSFGNNGQGGKIIRFDPDVQRLVNNTQLLLTAGAAGSKEDVFVIRSVSVGQDGAPHHSLVNLSGFTQAQESNLQTDVRAFRSGGHGNGRKVAVSPDNSRVAWAFKDRFNTGDERRDWLNVASTSGSSYSKIKHVYKNANEQFKIAGPLTNDRAICGLRFIDNTRLIFMMGLDRYDDPLAVNSSNAPQMDLFLYDTTTDVITNLTKTGNAAGDGFSALGQMTPAGYFAAPGGGFAYVIRAGGIGSVQFPSSPSLFLTPGTAVTNIIGINMATLDVFAVTGTEISGSALVPNLTLASGDLAAPSETVASMNFVSATGVQDGIIYFSAHRAGGNGSDDVFALDRDSPFVTFGATSATMSGVHVTNIAPDPYGGRVAFARTATSDAFGPTQHPYVVDLDNFLFERDLLPKYVSGGNPLGRVMDGSFHFIAPTGSAGDAFVFAFGLIALNGGIAGLATPAYYPLGAVSDLLAEPIPVIIPLVDTFLLGQDFRFYIAAAGPSKN